MRHAMERGWLLIGFILTGCQNAPETRFLGCIPRPPLQEARSYDLHDPFPDEHLGPNTFTRPRQFITPRTEQRKTNDLRYLQAARNLTPDAQVLWDPNAPSAIAGAPVQPIWRTGSIAPPIVVEPRLWDGGTSRYDVVR